MGVTQNSYIIPSSSSIALGTGTMFTRSQPGLAIVGQA